MKVKTKAQLKQELLKKTFKTNKDFQNLEKYSGSVYENKDKILVYLFSQKYKTAWYWFGFGETHKELLDNTYKKTYILLGCDYTKTKSVVIPYTKFKKMLTRMSKTKVNSKQWQVKLYNDGEEHAFLKFLNKEMLDISNYMV